MSLSNLCVSRISSPSFQIPHQKSELFSVTDNQTATSNTHLSLFEQLVSSDTYEGNSLRAVETLHDICPQQDKSIIESVLPSFDYDVSEAVEWFVDVPAPNLDTRVNDTALNTEFIGILDVDNFTKLRGHE